LNPEFGPFTLVMDLPETINAKAILYTAHGDFRFTIPTGIKSEKKVRIM
jgi:hypothetical protein